MSDLLENNLQLTTAGDVKPPAELDEAECFAPFVPQVSAAPTIKQTPPVSVFEKLLRDAGCLRTPTAATPETGVLAPVAAGSTGNTDMPTARPSEILAASVEAPLPIPPKATAVQIFNWIKRSIVAQTHLPDDAAALVALWVISTWFQDTLAVLPCLVISGPAHNAMVVLRVLNDFCCKPVLVAEFRKGDLETLNWGCQTLLISEPNLDNRKAALLGNLTNRGFRIVADGSAIVCSKSRAIYIGEDPATKKIQHSIHINIVPTKAEPPTPLQGLQTNIEYIPVHLNQYREKNLYHVRRWPFIPFGLSSETAAIAAALGRCIVDQPKLQEKLVGLLKAQDQQHRSQTLGTAETVVVEAALALSRQGREHVYAREIAAEANRLLEVRGEGLKLSPEKVGHRLRKLGLLTRRLSQAGNGLVLDKATVAAIKQLAAMYVEEDMPADIENLHCSQAAEKKEVEEVM